MMVFPKGISHSRVPFLGEPCFWECFSSWHNLLPLDLCFLKVLKDSEKNDISEWSHVLRRSEQPLLENTACWNWAHVF